MMTACYGCDKEITWKTGQDGRKKRFNTDGTSHYCKDCQYCERKIEWRNNEYVNTTDLKKHSCEEYFTAQNKIREEVKEIEQTGKLVAPSPTPKQSTTIIAEPSKPAPTTTRTTFEIQQEQKSQDIKRAHNENMDVANLQIATLKNLGLTLGDLVTAINSQTETIAAYGEAIITLTKELAKT
jgi:hypothetical protein